MNDSEAKFAEFLNSNHISWEKPPEKYGDFYISYGDILIEHKSLGRTELTKVLDCLNSSYRGPIKYVGAVSSKHDIHSFDSIKEKLSDANKKAERSKKDKKYKGSIFLCIISIDEGWDLDIVDLLAILQSAKFINYPFKPNQNGIYDKGTLEYFLTKNPIDNFDLLKRIDYVGIVRKNENFTLWKIELIQRPNKTKGLIEKPPNKLLNFMRIYKPIFI